MSTNEHKVNDLMLSIGSSPDWEVNFKGHFIAEELYESQFLLSLDENQLRVILFLIANNKVQSTSLQKLEEHLKAELDALIDELEA